MAEQALLDILLLLRGRTGHDFRGYRPATVLRRIERRMQVNAMPTLADYGQLLETGPGEAQHLMQDLLIGVTNFFRDADAFEAMGRHVVPALVDAATDEIRGWIAGCSTGDEAYSLAMLFHEAAASKARPPTLRLLATDVDERAIGVARLGAYPSAIEADVSPGRLSRFFDKFDGQYRVRKELRDSLMFATHNLLSDPPFAKLRFVSCRNLLMYLDRAAQQQILEMIHYSLEPGGYLFLGSSESVDAAATLFSAVDRTNRIFRADRADRSAYRSRVDARPRDTAQRRPVGPALPVALPVARIDDPAGHVRRQALMQPMPCDQIFTDAGWMFELMPQGYRMLATLAHGRCTLHSLRGIDVTCRFAEAAAALETACGATSAVFDAWIGAADATTRLDRPRLHRRATRGLWQASPQPSQDRVSLQIFDVLCLDGDDLRPLPWWQRRQRLARLRIEPGGVLRIQNTVRSHGHWLAEQAAALGHVALSARRRDSAYIGGMSSDWREIRVHGADVASVEAER